jgi:predicted ATP-dependent serine protease
VIDYGRDYPDTQDDEPTPDLLAGLRNGAWLDQQQFPPLCYAVPGIIPEGFTLKVGAPKIGKSWFVLDCALAVAAGGRALGVIPVDKRPVLYLALEDGDRRIQERCRVLLNREPIPADFEYMTRIEAGSLFATITEWIDRCPDAAPLIIIDTLGKIMPPSLSGESAYQRDYRIGGQLKRFADQHPGTCVLVNHHDRKAESADFVDSVSGTHGLAGAADTVMTLSRARHDKDGLVMVTGRDVAEGEYAVTFTDGGRWMLDGRTLADAAAVAAQRRATAGVGDRSVEILHFVGEHKGGVRAGEVELKLGKDARRYLSRLADSGRLSRLSRGLYALPQPQGLGVVDLVVM